MRAAHALTAAAVGALLAWAALAGMDAATERPPPASKPLDLDGYCRDMFGEQARGYKPSNHDGWRCATWVNGVWGLERVDLAAGCRWQRGPAAHLEAEARQAPTASDTPRRELLCTL